MTRDLASSPKRDHKLSGEVTTCAAAETIST